VGIATTKATREEKGGRCSEFEKGKGRRENSAKIVPKNWWKGTTGKWPGA